MAQFALGTRPVGFVVVLNQGSIFRSRLRNKNWDWPLGTTLELRFSDGTVWTAAYSGAYATWSKSAADVAGVLDAKTVELFYVSSDGPVRWAQGKVEVV